MNEFKELKESYNILENSGIYVDIDENNIDYVYALLVGPENTPYEKGFYFFRFEYPSTYPMQPPIAKYYTQGIILNSKNNKHYQVRFNPNLYTCGKVCLSMLNTWNGPGWVPTNTISNVLVAIQALVLNENPLTNEPGFEDGPLKDLNDYNDFISYANIKISILEILTNIPEEFLFFRTKMIEIFLKNIDYYKNFILTKSKTMDNKYVKIDIYGMSLTFNYLSLLDEIENVKKSIL